MTRTQQGGAVIGGILVVSALILVAAIGWGPKDECFPIKFPAILGCALAQYENLSGGLIAAGGALFAGWLAWSAVREQVELERGKVRSSEIAEQSRIADEISRDLFDIRAAQIAGRNLLQRLREELSDPFPYANRFVEMWAAKQFPTTSVTWSPRVLGDELLNILTRMRMLAEGITEEIRLNNPMQRNGILMSREPAASDSVAEFNACLERLTFLIDGRQQALSDANAKLAELRGAITL